MGPLGWKEILIILFIVVLLFGARKLPELARGMGKSIKEFKKATAEGADDEDEAEKPEASRNGAEKAAKVDTASKN
jgi:sec-independent protein translocase protein TatA